MPAKARSNDRVFLLFKNCVASLVFHRAFLKAHLHSRSNVRTSIFLAEEVPHAMHVTVKHEWDKTEDSPQITGIPPDVMVLSELETLREEMKEMKKWMI